jgi:hypothetical protein
MTQQQRRPGRPRKAPGEAKNEYVEMRLASLEKQAFRDAADIAGVPLATWMRERLRAVAIRELESAGRRVAFIREVPLRGRT